MTDDSKYSIVLSNNHLITNYIQQYLIDLKRDDDIGINNLHYVNGTFEENKEYMEHMGLNCILSVIKHGTLWGVVFRANGEMDHSESVSKGELARVIAFVMIHFGDYLVRELKYMKERPWLNLVGLTPKEAVKWLRENGWPLVDQNKTVTMYPIELTLGGVQFKDAK